MARVRDVVGRVRRGPPAARRAGGDRASRALGRARALCPNDLLTIAAEKKVDGELRSDPHGDALLLRALAEKDPRVARELFDRAAFALENAAGEARVVDVGNGPTGALRTARFSPNGELLAIAQQKTISIYRDGRIARTLRGHTDLVGALVFSPDGTQLATASRDATVRIWDLASGARDGSLRVVSLATGALLHKRFHRPAIESVAFAADGQLATGGVDGTIDVGPALAAPSITFRHWSEPVLALAFVDTMTLASGSLDGSVGTFSVASGARLSLDEGHSDGVTGVAIAPDGIVSSSADGTLRWSGRAIAGHEDAVLSLALYDEGRVVSGGEDGSIRIFSRTGAFVVGMRALRRSADFIAFTGDGYFDARGGALTIATCRIGAIHYPIELCAERFAVDDLWSRALRGDVTFRD